MISVNRTKKDSFSLGYFLEGAGSLTGHFLLGTALFSVKHASVRFQDSFEDRTRGGRNPRIWPHEL